MMRAAVDDSVPDRVQARQLQTLELVEQRIEGNLRTLKLAIGFCERSAVGVVDPILSAAPSATIDSTLPETEYSANLHDDEPTLMHRMT
jgi:hypothetical protein